MRLGQKILRGIFDSRGELTLLRRRPDEDHPWPGLFQALFGRILWAQSSQSQKLISAFYFFFAGVAFAFDLGLGLAVALGFSTAVLDLGAALGLAVAALGLVFAAALGLGATLGFDAGLDLGVGLVATVNSLP